MRKLILLLPWFAMAAVWGQDQPAAPPNGQPAGTPPGGVAPQTTPQNQPGGSSKKGQTGTSKDRLFFALPNFLTLENAKNVPPMTAGDKFKVTAKSSFDPVEFFWYGALAGLSQWENSESGFGQGGEAYAKRYGSYFADGTIENFMTEAIYPSIFHQDPRYYQLGKGGFWHRTGYAISRIFVTRSDSGHFQFNVSEILGSATASAISTFTYHPRDNRNLGNAASVWGSQVGYDTLTYVVKEFWPDIRRKLHKPKTQGP
jgi:hypothetical protein